jgi:uncharacterized protein YjbI with pentapeptide repeats
MADPDHLRIVRQGTDHWNEFSLSTLTKASLYRADLIGASLSKANLRKANLRESDLSGADLSGASLYGANLDGANLSRANLSRAKFSKANLKNADLSGAYLCGASLSDINLSGANLREADLIGANLYRANLSGACLIRADLSAVNLQRVILVGADLTEANLTGCFVYGLSAWDVKLKGAIQSDLVITPADTPTITVDNLEVAQFIYLLLNNQRVRQVIDTITSKVVLILGRFTPERKIILDAIRDELRNRDYLPVLFDFEKPSSRDITETVSTLAHMARFVIADITDAKSIPQELMAIVPNLPSVPVQPLLLASQQEYGMFEHFKRFPWVLEPYLYQHQDHLLAAITDKVIGPAEAKVKERTQR